MITDVITCCVNRCNQRGSMAIVARISEAEWQVMQVVWDRAPVAAAEVIKRLEGQSGWNHRTIRTLLNRLVKKDVLSYRVDGNRYLYHLPVQTGFRAKRESPLSKKAVKTAGCRFEPTPIFKPACAQSAGDLMSPTVN